MRGDQVTLAAQQPTRGERVAHVLGQVGDARPFGSVGSDDKQSMPPSTRGYMHSFDDVSGDSAPDDETEVTSRGQPFKTLGKGIETEGVVPKCDRTRASGSD